MPFLSLVAESPVQGDRALRACTGRLESYSITDPRKHCDGDAWSSCPFLDTRDLERGGYKRSFHLPPHLAEAATWPVRFAICGRATG